MMLYEVNSDKPTRYMHLPTIPYLVVRKQEMEGYPWDYRVVTIDGNDANFLFDGKSLYVDFSDGERSEAQAAELEKECEGMTKEESEEFMTGKIVNYRHRVEHIVQYTDGKKFSNVVDLINKIIA